MRGGVARWKRGVGGSGIASAAAYAFAGACDAGAAAEHTDGVIAGARYAGSTVERFTVTDGGIAVDELDVDRLQAWFSGADPETGERRGRELSSPATDLVFDATINAPKSFSLAAVLDPDLSEAYEGLQDRLRDRVITMWKDELNGRRGAAGLVREDLAQIEVVELRHERSRALDAHKHRHLWLNAKVLGRDGKWSSLDSRVMLRFQNVVNAEGDLAARTDPEWLAALAAKGYTLDADGEIEQLAAVVRPLSRRSNQIEANRSARLAEWRTAHPGQEPGPDILAAIDRWAWAYQRPGKPGHVDEAEWADRVRREIADIDPAIVSGRGRDPVPVAGQRLADIDRDLLAQVAVADADNRSASCGGRFSDFDLRAGATRAVAASGVVADRAQLSELIEDVTARAAENGTVALTTDTDIPGHVKHRMSTHTYGAKVQLADSFEKLAAPGIPVDVETVTAVAEKVLTRGRSLDSGQTAAAGAIAGTDRLVTVTGPAGTGKTTMLRVARTLLENQGRRMVIVAPTKKAASVAGRETDTAASSLHALLHDYGFRWKDTPTGQQWTRLVPGQVDRESELEYTGPSKIVVRKGDRVVVDEAGMVDLHSAIALAQVARETGAQIAMVGDHLQALPVGHSGAMSLMRTRSSAVVELEAVHRFVDKAWADMSLRIREPGGQVDAVAAAIISTGHAAIVATEADARHHMVEEWLTGHASGERVALVTATHEEAQAISEAIQGRRLEAGELDTRNPLVLQGGQVAYVGDIVQTRRNTSEHDVENRQQWVISRVEKTLIGRIQSVTLTSVEDAGMRRQVSGEYLAEHTHLSYASTVHGVQGETTDRSVVGPGVDAAGLYVGLTRGRKHNEAVVVAGSESAARAELVETMQRGQIEATIEEARQAAAADLARAARRAAVPLTAERQVAAWHDRQVRPLGHVTKLAEMLADALEREKALHEQIGRLGEKISTDEDAVREIDAKIAAYAARQHAATVGGEQIADAAPPIATRTMLLERIKAARAERGELSAEYRKVNWRIQAAHREGEIREQLGADVTAYEDDARRRAARAKFAREIPAWDDRKARRFGREKTILARQVADRAELEQIDKELSERSGRIRTAQEMLRTGAGPGGVQLTPAQRDQIAGLLAGAQHGYDEAAQKREKVTRRQRAVEREIEIRQQLSVADPQRAAAEDHARRTGAAVPTTSPAVVPAVDRGPSLS